VAKKSSAGRRTPKKSARKGESDQTPKKLVVEVDIDTGFRPPVFYQCSGSWRVGKVLAKRRK
jgi:hypothetical protein